jgi:hypothetical protein
LNFDASLLKRINLTERVRFEIGAQALNLFNHSQFIGGYLSDVNPFGTAAISRNFLVLAMHRSDNMTSSSAITRARCSSWLASTSSRNSVSIGFILGRGFGRALFV